MNTQKQREIFQMEDKSKTYVFLIDVVSKSFKRLILAVKSIWIYAKLHIQYGSSIKINVINSIKGKFKIELFPQSSLQIGKFLMCAGPCYIKCTEKGQCKIGNNVFINHNCSITCVEKITIGDNSNIANNVVIVDHDHKIGKYGVIDGLESSPVHIGKNVWVGANAVILKGVSIGDGAVIAAGAVVNHDIPDYEIWGGVPVRKIKNVRE